MQRPHIVPYGLRSKNNSSSGDSDKKLNSDNDETDRNSEGGRVLERVSKVVGLALEDLDRAFDDILMHSLITID